MDTVMIGFLGTNLDRGGSNRWERWRPTVDLFRHDDLLINRLELLTVLVIFTPAFWRK